MSYIPNGLTAFDLQVELNAELKKIFKGKHFESPSGEEKEIALYIQNLPEPEADDDAEVTEAPYIINRIIGGTIPDWNSFSGTKSISIVLLICIYSQSKTDKGYIDLLSIIQRIENHFGIYRFIGNFEVVAPFEYVLSEDDERPFHFAGISLKFEARRTVKEDKLT